ncbi:hypothetical protein ACQ86N_41685 [Puia sp. P3]|uniref:hypothetical protein n=1 Tax=Puia sp. P3 TaxID=3423952 RepID=UPI003D679CBA
MQCPSFASILTALILISFLPAAAQHNQREHIPYDDSMLTSEAGPYAMPYNRWIDPAGVVVRFGDPKLENHSLDAVMLPGQAAGGRRPLWHRHLSGGWKAGDGQV